MTTPLCQVAVSRALFLARSSSRALPRALFLARPFSRALPRAPFLARSLSRALFLTPSCRHQYPPAVKKTGFFSFGYWATTRHSAARSARDVLQQSIELAVAAEQLG